MKKMILAVVILLGSIFTIQAQEISKNALGIRMGDNDGFGGEISYQRGLLKTTRLELDLGWRNRYDVNGVKLAGVYQWVWNIDGGFNWFAGVGGGLGSWHGGGTSGSFAFLAGNIGIEYGFTDVPILLSLDFRPEFGGGNYYKNNYGSDVAFGIRYKF